MRMEDFWPAEGWNDALRGLELWLPNRKHLTGLYFPTGIEVPAEGKVRWVGSQFLNVAGAASAYANIQLHPSFLVTALLGASKSGNSFAVQITHNIAGGGQRFFFSTYVDSGIALGTAQHPAALKESYLIRNNDSVRIEVKNYFGVASGTSAVDSFWVALFGCDISDSLLQPASSSTKAAA